MKPPSDQPFLFPDLSPPPATPDVLNPPPNPAALAAAPFPDAAETPSATSAEASGDLAPVESASTELRDWKDELRQDFEAWLESLDSIPEPDSEAEAALQDAPDLYSFYEQFAAANVESRKANRRTAEAISQWGETLARFESSLAPLRETTAQLAAAQPKEGQMSRSHCLMLVELLDRMHRLAGAFQSSPPLKKSWWGGGHDAAWRHAWETQRQALDILVSHLQNLLKQEGVTLVEAVGQPFDPAVMMAVAVEPDAALPPQTVVEEVAAGYRRHGELLRAAQVKVTRKP